MFGLAAIAAVAAMAFIGATSASASSTQLCKKDTAGVAPSAAECERITSVHAESVGHLKLVTKSILGTITVECDGLLQATLPSTLASPLTTTAATLTYSGCLNGCEAKVIKQGTVSTLFLSLANEQFDVTGANFEVLANCLGIHCVYNAEKLVGKGTGPLSTASGFGEVVYTNAPATKVSGTFCPETSLLTGTFRDLTKNYVRE